MSGFHDCEPDRCNYCGRMHPTEDCPHVPKVAASGEQTREVPLAKKGERRRTHVDDKPFDALALAKDWLTHAHGEDHCQDDDEVCLAKQLERAYAAGRAASGAQPIVESLQKIIDLKKTLSEFCAMAAASAPKPESAKKEAIR